MAIYIRRREFIVTLGNAAAAWPLAARAQQLSVVSILVAGSIPKIEQAGLYHQGNDSSSEPNPRRWLDTRSRTLPA